MNLRLVWKPNLFNYYSTLLTYDCICCNYTKAHAMTVLSSSTFCSCPHRYIQSVLQNPISTQSRVQLPLLLLSHHYYQPLTCNLYKLDNTCSTTFHYIIKTPPFFSCRLSTIFQLGKPMDHVDPGTNFEQSSLQNIWNRLNFEQNTLT